MTFMKTSDLSDGYLDLAVAQALGHKDCFVNLAGNCVQPYKTNDGFFVIVRCSQHMIAG